MFEVSYLLYLHTGNAEHHTKALPYFDRYLNYPEAHENENGDIPFGLYDWAPPDLGNTIREPSFINAVLRIKFLRITVLAAKLAGITSKQYEDSLKHHISRQKKVSASRRYLRN